MSYLCNERSLLVNNIKAISTEFKQAVQELYGDRLAQVILYGSYARGDFNDNSDIDLLIVLKDKKINNLQEIKRLNPITSKISIKYKVLVSSVAVSEQNFITSDYLFFTTLRKEGIRL